MSTFSSNGTETQQLLPFMEKLWMSFAQSIEARDKFLRTVFFGTKMIDSYFENHLSDENKERLSLVMSTVSQARKAFRLLKSFNHVSNILEVFTFQDDQLYSGDSEAVVKVLTQLCWAICFYYDNKLFFARTKLFNLSESYNYGGFTKAWCAADIFSCIGCLLKLKQLMNKRDAIIAREVSGASTDDTDLAEVSQVIRDLDADIRRTMLRLFKCVLNIIVSGDHSGLWRSLFRRSLGTGHVGLLGMIASGISVYEEVSLVMGGDTRDASLDAAIEKEGFSRL